MREVAKIIKHKQDAREKFLAGIYAVTDAVQATLGPQGKTVIIEQPGIAPHITKDGVTVARSISLTDPFENMGAQIIKQVALKSLEMVGDGTTTATVLAAALIRGAEKFRERSPNTSMLDISKGMQAQIDKIVTFLRENTYKVEALDTIRHVATLAANGDTSIGNLIADAFEVIGKDGIIGLEESKMPHSYVEIVKGISFNQGYMSPSFVTRTDKMICELENPLIFIYEHELTNIDELIPLFNQLTKMDRSVLVMAEDIQGDAIRSFILNKLKGNLKVGCCRLPKDTTYNLDIVGDIALTTGAKTISDRGNTKLSKVTMDMLGSARKVILSADKTIIMDGNGDSAKIEHRIQGLKAQLDNPELTAEERALLEVRIARMTTGIAMIRVGGTTEMEMKERKDRAEDAKYATTSAVKGGVSRGGGIGLLAVEQQLKSDLPTDVTTYTAFQMGQRIALDALKYPLHQLLLNAGFEKDKDAMVLKERRQLIQDREEGANPFMGFDVKTLERVDMLEKGILDPTEVLCSALEGAVSVASLALTMEVMIAHSPESRKTPMIPAMLTQPM